MNTQIILKVLAQRHREDRTPTLISELEASISRATAYSREHLEDLPEIREWVWTS
jgi:phosphoketolase